MMIVLTILAIIYLHNNINRLCDKNLSFGKKMNLEYIDDVVTVYIANKSCTASHLLPFINKQVAYFRLLNHTQSIHTYLWILAIATASSDVEKCNDYIALYQSPK